MNKTEYSKCREISRGLVAYFEWRHMIDEFVFKIFNSHKTSKKLYLAF